VLIRVGLVVANAVSLSVFLFSNTNPVSVILLVNWFVEIVVFMPATVSYSVLNAVEYTVCVAKILY